MINVSNIERFAVHDGPGIRTTVFLKGCPLHCPWCANPETWSIESVLMHDEKKCITCGACQKLCPNQAIHIENHQWKINQELCEACGKCKEACLKDALSINGTWMEVEDVFKEVLKDLAYYQESHGGMTLSGGEPLFQEEGAIQLLKLAKENHLHTAIETTGNYPLEILQKVEPYINLFLWDIKHLDQDKLKSVVGLDKEVYLTNLDWLLKKRRDDIIARIPVIPGFNDQIVEEMIAFAKEKGIKKIHLLPYHSLGKDKWKQLGKKYPYEDIKMMSKESLEKYQDDIVQVGGS